MALLFIEHVFESRVTSKVWTTNETSGQQPQRSSEATGNAEGGAREQHGDHAQTATT